MSRRRPTHDDYARVRAGFVGAGLDRDFYNGDDIALLWSRYAGDVERIVAAAVQHARRIGTTKGVQL